MIWSKEVLMDRSLCRNILAVAMGTDNRYFMHLRRLMAVDGKTLLMIITGYTI